MLRPENLQSVPLGMQFLGGTNLLTGHTDAHWRAVRKGVAPAFSACNMRYANVREMVTCVDATRYIEYPVYHMYTSVTQGLGATCTGCVDS